MAGRAVRDRVGVVEGGCRAGATPGCSPRSLGPAVRHRLRDVCAAPRPSWTKELDAMAAVRGNAGTGRAGLQRGPGGLDSGPPGVRPASTVASSAWRSMTGGSSRWFLPLLEARPPFRRGSTAGSTTLTAWRNTRHAAPRPRDGGHDGARSPAGGTSGPHAVSVRSGRTARMTAAVV